jgi:hypothetical protein
VSGFWRAAWLPVRLPLLTSQVKQLALIDLVSVGTLEQIEIG